ncbi:hypothetical protein EK21DRAFT_110669 [Setomelanomma holmii]|uniref:DUF7924 domain-containing protein n=1 Tax=Setomelanomma holmii TaxID=210430 RepID=A0A9P4HED4_9PLEO|nr:hypothetical protein EK21DRAFT_110669 [Setomelanomma holmii]
MLQLEKGAAKTEESLFEPATNSYSSAKSSAASASAKHTENRYAFNLEFRGYHWKVQQQPANHGEIMAALQKARADELTDEEAKDIICGIAKAENDLVISTMVLPEVLKSGRFLSKSSPYCLVPGASWLTEIPLERLVWSKGGISPPEPDMSMGLRPDAAPESGVLVCKYMGPYFTPIICAPRLWCPFFTIETEIRQNGISPFIRNVHNAAVMMRNLRRIHQDAGDNIEDDFDGKAHVLTLIFARNHIELSCHWSRKKSDLKVEYFVNRLMFWSTSLMVAEAKQMVTYIRNAMDWVREHNRECLEDAIEKLEKKIEAGEAVLDDVVDDEQD